MAVLVTVGFREPGARVSAETGSGGGRRASSGEGGGGLGTAEQGCRRGAALVAEKAFWSQSRGQPLGGRRPCGPAPRPSFRLPPPGKPATRLGGSSRQLPGGPSGATDPCGPSTVKPNRRGSNPDEAQACDSLSPSRSSPRRGAGVWEPHRVVVGRGPDPLCRHFTFARFVSA